MSPSRVLLWCRGFTMLAAKVALAGGMGNALLVDDLEAMMRAGGFEEIRIQPRDESKEFIKDGAPGQNVTDFVVSAAIEAVTRGSCCGACSC